MNSCALQEHSILPIMHMFGTISRFLGFNRSAKVHDLANYVQSLFNGSSLQSNNGL
jgi:hypothetical protein